MHTFGFLLMLAVASLFMCAGMLLLVGLLMQGATGIHDKFTCVGMMVIGGLMCMFAFGRMPG